MLKGNSGIAILLILLFVIVLCLLVGLLTTIKPVGIATPTPTIPPGALMFPLPDGCGYLAGDRYVVTQKCMVEP